MAEMGTSIRSTVFLFLLILSMSQALKINDRPIIGVIAQRLSEPLKGSNGTSYISAAYIKWLESSGARVVPIKIDITKTELKKLFGYINGVVLPGGDAYLMKSPYHDNAEYIMKLAMEEYHKGDPFPIWGTCLGFQAFAVLTCQTDDVLSYSKGTWDSSLPLDFTEDTKQSRLFSNAPRKIMEILKNEAVTYNAHYNCVTIETYRKSHQLNSFFKLISTNRDTAGEIFVSTMEGHRYPFYAVQWHPEMISYEFNNSEGLGPNINHSPNSIVVSQYLANFFVNEARKSRHRFPDKKTERQYLMYNYNPVYTAVKDWFDEQAYVF